MRGNDPQVKKNYSAFWYDIIRIKWTQTRTNTINTTLNHIDRSKVYIFPIRLFRHPCTWVLKLEKDAYVNTFLYISVRTSQCKNISPYFIVYLI